MPHHTIQLIINCCNQSKFKWFWMVFCGFFLFLIFFNRCIGWIGGGYLPNLCVNLCWEMVIFSRHRWIWRIIPIGLIDFWVPQMSWRCSDWVDQRAVVEHFVYLAMVVVVSLLFFFLTIFYGFCCCFRFGSVLVSITQISSFVLQFFCFCWFWSFKYLAV